ncbi:MAG TPA: TetR/AcrR family transcriptional regulator [Marmoricola sp.]
MEEPIAAPAEPAATPELATVTPLRKRGRPRDVAADGRILTAAAQLFLDRGFDAMTIDAVAERAEVGKATVYRRWASKEDLAAAAILHLYGVGNPVPDTGSLFGDLVWAYAQLLSFVSSSAGRNYLRITIGESIRDPRVARLHRVATTAMEEKAQVIFERAATRGEIDPTVPAAWAVQWVLGLVLTAVLTDRDQPGPADAERLARMIVDGIAHR